MFLDKAKNTAINSKEWKRIVDDAQNPTAPTAVYTSSSIYLSPIASQGLRKKKYTVFKNNLQ